MRINHRDTETQLKASSCVPGCGSVSLWLKLYLFGLLFVLACVRPSVAQESGWVREARRAGDFELVRGGRAADVLVAAEDFKVVRIAADDLAAAVERVTGVRPAVRTEAKTLSSHAVLVG